MKKTLLLEVICSLFIILFLYTGIYKLLEQSRFRAALNESPLLAPYQVPIGIGTPLLEVLIGSSLLYTLFKENNSLRKWALGGSLVLMAVFTIYVWYMLRTPTKLPCTCGGIIQQLNWHQHLYFNTTFTLLALLGLMLNRRVNAAAGNISLTV